MLVTLNELITHLEKIRRQSGGDDTIMVTGLYGACHALEQPVENYVRRERTEQTSRIVIETDLT